MTERSGRYERLEEYMELCYKLWDSWEPDAIVADKVSGIYADPAKVHEVVHHEGEYFRCNGRHFVCAVSARPTGALAGRLIRSRARLCGQARRGDLRGASDCGRACGNTRTI